MNEKTFPGPIQISLAKAKEWEKKYHGDTTAVESKKKAIGFLIPRESLEKVLELNTEAVRAYIGINDQDEKTLLFVGAELNKETGKYIDVYGRSSALQKTASLTSETENPEEIVYDGTRPSPPY